MKNYVRVLVALTIAWLGLSGRSAGAPKKAPLSGSWGCVAHQANQDDTQFTLTLTQEGEKVTGSYQEVGGNEKATITDGSFKEKKLAIHFDAYGGTAAVTGTLSKPDEMSGDWSLTSGGQGTWECKRSTAAPTTK